MNKLADLDFASIAASLLLMQSLMSCTAPQQPKHGEISRYVEMRRTSRAGIPLIVSINKSPNTVAFIYPNIWNIAPIKVPRGIVEMMPPPSIPADRVVILGPLAFRNFQLDRWVVDTGTLTYSAAPYATISKALLKQIHRQNVTFCDKGKLVIE